MIRAPIRIILGLLLIGFTLGQAPAQAAPGDWKLGAGPLFASEFDPDLAHGLGAEVYVEYGLGEYVGLTATGTYAHHGLAGGQAYDLANLDLGFSFNLDVLVLVPFAQIRLGWLNRWPESGGSQSGTGATLALGADWLLSENLHAGLSMEFRAMLSHMDQHPFHMTINLRLGWTFLD